MTYRRSADFREEGTGFYDRVYTAERPELFFKASAWRCVGPGGAIGRRADSAFTAAEPEIAIVLDRAGRDPGLHARERRLGLGHRARQPALPAAVQGLQRLLRLRAGDRHARRDPGPVRARAALPRDAGRPRGVRGRGQHRRSSSAASRRSCSGCCARTTSAPAPCSRPAPASSSRSDVRPRGGRRGDAVVPGARRARRIQSRSSDGRRRAGSLPAPARGRRGRRRRRCAGRSRASAPAWCWPPRSWARAS